MKVALAQINPIVGDIDGNVGRILEFARQASERRADIVIFPELCICGYPPLDLLENESFIDSCEAAVSAVARGLPDGIAAIVGSPLRNPAPVGKRLHNAAILLDRNERIAVVHKTLLPTYDVFDEYRYFEPGRDIRVIEWKGLRLGLHICEDMWNNEEQAEYHLYPDNPVDDLANLGADIFVNISASPFSTGKHDLRNQVLSEICREHSLPFILVNQVGANTEVVFDGDSRVHAADGKLVLCAPLFEESLLVWDSEIDYPACSNAYDETEELHGALTRGISDYFHKTGVFSKAIVGLSGGIDSAVTCALAVGALGPDRVVGATMPSRYSSTGSVTDSEVLAENLGIEFHRIPIEPAVAAFESMLETAFAGTEAGVAEENIQARSRGVTLMAISNKYGYLLLSTGNKSEMSVGYATLYGDMNGGLAVLADVYKTQVYALARYINQQAGYDVIPSSTITKPPSAELRPNQRDSDSLPDYDTLDEILSLYVEGQCDLDQIISRTHHEPALVRRILNMVDRSEYKRRQAAPGIRVSTKAFGMGRRVPIVMRWSRAESSVTTSKKAAT